MLGGHGILPVILALEHRGRGIAGVNWPAIITDQLRIPLRDSASNSKSKRGMCLTSLIGLHIPVCVCTYMYMHAKYEYPCTREHIFVKSTKREKDMC